MIYLFEDRKGRMSLLLTNKIESNNFKEVIFDCPVNITVAEYIKNEFSNAKAILFHASYSIANKAVTRENVRSEFIKLKIPVVFFSGALENNYFFSGGTIQGNVNGETMYKNLNRFMSEYDKTGQLNIPLLIFGSKYLLNELITLQHLTVAYLAGKTDSAVITNEEKEYLITLIEPTIKDKTLTDDKNKLINWLKIPESEIKSITLKDHLQKLANKHQ